MQMSRKDAYRHAALIYDWLIEPFMAPIRKKTSALLAQNTPAAEGLRVLEVACGTGSQIRRITGPGRFTIGLERSFGMLLEAEKKSRLNRSGVFHLVAGNGADLPFADGVFDVLLAQFVLHEMPGPIRAGTVREMLRVARDDACFLAADFVPTPGVTVSKIALTAVEFAAGQEHFRNGRQFLKEGGIVSLLAGFGLEIIERWPFLGGNFGLVLARKSTSG